MQKLRGFLLALSGARAEILDRCPSERVKFESLGWAILITSGLATVSMWFALSSAMGINGFAAIIPALAWGLVIMGIDRWLITSMPVDSTRRKFAIAVPRFLLAVLLGTLISTPLVLRIFQSEINAQISVIKAQRASSFLAQEQKSDVAQQVAYWRGQVANLQKVVDSGGATPLNPSADSDVQSLTRQLSQEESLANQYYHDWQCQLYGGPGCPPGQGPLADASEASYHQAQAQVSQLTQAIRQREATLAATDKASEKARYDQASEALPNALNQLSLAQARQTELQTNFDAQNEATNGILIRLQALSQLSTGDFTVAAARFLLFLLFLVIECLPVTVKLMQQPGNYEQILQAERGKELREARRHYQARPETNGEPSVRDIWLPKTTVLPPADDAIDTEVIQPAQTREDALDYPYSGEFSPLDQAIRGMEDHRVAASPDGRTGGIPLRWDDDDR